MKRQSITAVLTLVGTLVPALPVIAQETINVRTPSLAQAPSAAASERAEKFKRMRLSDEQLEKLHALKAKYAADNDQKKATLKTLRGQLKDVLTAVTVDKGAALSIQSKISALQADLSASRVAMMADASTIFTTEQRQEFRRKFLMRDMGGGHHGRGHHGGRFHAMKMKGPGGPGGPGFGRGPGGPGRPRFGPGASIEQKPEISEKLESPNNKQL